MDRTIIIVLILFICAAALGYLLGHIIVALSL